MLSALCFLIPILTIACQAAVNKHVGKYAYEDSDDDLSIARLFQDASLGDDDDWKPYIAPEKCVVVTKITNFSESYFGQRDEQHLNPELSQLGDQDYLEPEDLITSYSGSDSGSGSGSDYESYSESYSESGSGLESGTESETNTDDSLSESIICDCNCTEEPEENDDGDENVYNEDKAGNECNDDKHENVYNDDSDSDENNDNHETNDNDEASHNNENSNEQVEEANTKDQGQSPNTDQKNNAKWWNVSSWLSGWLTKKPAK